MSAAWRRVVHGGDLVALHRRLQGADRVDLGHLHPAAGLAQAGGRALAHVAEAVHHGDLAGHHHVGAAADGVHQAFAAAVQIVELRLRDAVVDVDGGHQQRAGAGHFPQPVHAGGGFLADAAHVGEHLRILVVHQQCQVAAVIEDQVRRPAVRPAHRLLDAPPELLLVHALPGEHRRARGGDGGGGVVLGGEDVARRPAHGGAEMLQGLDQHGGLDGHVQTAGDARAGERPGLAIFAADGHQARHFVLGHGDLLGAPFGEGDVLDLVVLGVGHGGLL